ncbi:MAG TPA: hypothetical protein VNZ86_19825 [Bacteroidia bacterium]|nr:hypothetical protein [Bacteroidia bacterium]
MIQRNLLVLFLVFIVSGSIAFAQDSPTEKNHSETRSIYKRKGNIYYYWGYNRDTYTRSDIHFQGKGYDFGISGVTASDEPLYDFSTYVNPGLFTIPQYNQRIGYFISDKWFVSVGHDHMKYELDRQAAELTGTISSGTNTGVYNKTQVLVGDNSSRGGFQPLVLNTLPRGFVTEFQHCDGLNDISVELGHLEQLWINKKGTCALSVQGSVGTGLDVLDTEADILGLEPKHYSASGKKEFHLAGYSFSSAIGLQLDFFKHFFILAKLKGGFVNLPDINTTMDGGKASQNFWFTERMLVVGYCYHIGSME